MSNVEHFDKFTPAARKVMELAQEEALHFQHDTIGTEHILLGLIREGESMSARVLDALNVTLEKVRKAVEVIKGRGAHVAQGELGLTPHAVAAIKMAIKEADAVHPQTTTPLFGTRSMSESRAAQILQDANIPPDLEALGVTLEEVRRALEEAKARGDSVIALRIETGMAPFAHNPANDTEWHHPLFSIDTENLFLGMTRVTDCTATKILQQLGIPIEELRPLMFLEHVSTLQTAHQGYVPNFTIYAKKAWSLAYKEARLLRDSYLGGHHLLLGLVSEGSGVAATTLKEMGIELDTMRKKIEDMYGHGAGNTSDNISSTQHLNNTIELAVSEAHRLHHRAVGTGDILLSLIRESQGLEAGLLQSLGVDFYALRTTLRQAPDEDSGDAEADAIADASFSAIERDIQSRELDKTIMAVYAFTVEARQVLEHARIEARNLEQRVGPEHLLLGLAYLTFRQEGPAGKTFKELGVDYAKTRAAIESRQGVKVNAVVLVQNALCRACLLLAAAEAERENGEGAVIKTEHILFGILQEPTGIIADLLKDLGTSVDEVRAKTREYIK